MSLTNEEVLGIVEAANELNEGEAFVISIGRSRITLIKEPDPVTTYGLTVDRIRLTPKQD